MEVAAGVAGISKEEEDQQKLGGATPASPGMCSLIVDEAKLRALREDKSHHSPNGDSFLNPWSEFGTISSLTGLSFPSWIRSILLWIIRLVLLTRAAQALPLAQVCERQRRVLPRRGTASPGSCCCWRHCFVSLAFSAPELMLAKKRALIRAFPPSDLSY